MAPRSKSDGKLAGAQKAAIIMMSIGEENASKLFAMMNEDEVREISFAMSNLGSLKSDTVENLLGEFVDQLSEIGPFTGNLETTEKLLERALGKEKVVGILEDISGPSGRTTWDKMNNVNEEVLAGYLKNEYPQTAAVVLTKLKPGQAAKVIGVMPDDYAIDVIMRMLSIEPVKKEVLAGLEKTLQAEFMSNLAKTKKLDSYEMIAEIFNNFDRNTENKFMQMLESREPISAERVKELMFTFDDIINIDAKGIQALLRALDKDKLAVALKGSSEEIRELFFKNMSERASKILKEDMEAKGPVRLRDVDEAQMYIVNIAKELSDKGEIIIAEDSEDEQLIY